MTLFLHCLLVVGIYYVLVVEATIALLATMQVCGATVGRYHHDRTIILYQHIPAL